MRIVIVILLCISTIAVPGVQATDIAKSIEYNNPIHETSLDNDTLGSESFELNVHADKSGQHNLTYDDTKIFSKENRKTYIDLNFEEIYKDRLSYYHNFSGIWSNGTGTLEETFNDENKITMLSTINGQNELEYSIAPQINIGSDIILDIEMDSLYFTGMNIYDNVKIDVYFDSIVIRIIYHATDNYLKLWEDDNDNLVAVDHRNGSEPINVAQLVAEHPELNYPSTMETMNFISYSSDIYNLSEQLSQISLYEYQDKITLIENGKNEVVDGSKTQIVQSDEIYTVQLAPDFTTHLHWSRYYNTTEIIEITPIPGKDRLDGRGGIQLTSDYTDYQVNFFVDQYFKTYYTDNHPDIERNGSYSVNGQNTTDIYLTGTLYLDRDVVAITGNHQGKNMTVELESKTYRGVYLFHHTSGMRKSFNISTLSGDANVTLPYSWPKGDISVFLLDLNATYQISVHKFELSPAQLVSSSVFRLTAGQKVKLPVILENITSGVSQPASKIMSYYANGSLRSVDDEFGMVVNPGEFEQGSTYLNINATFPGLVPQQFIMRLIVEPLNPTTEITVTRQAPRIAILDINIIELANISVSSILYLKGDGINHSQQLTGQYSEIRLNNDEWKDDETYNINAVLVIGDNFERYNYSITIPVAEDDSTGLIMTGVSLFVLFITAGMKVYQSKYGSETIHF